jgi:large subunit ribosomal protein L24
MKSEFSPTWNSSSKPKKQRKYCQNAPLHLKRKLLGAHLSPELRTKHAKRSLVVRKGDKVKVMRGEFTGHIGNVDRVDTGKSRVYIRGVEKSKKDGTKIFVGIHPSKLMILEIKLQDKKRVQSMKRK